MKTVLFESGFIIYIARVTLSVFSQANFPNTINPENIKSERVSRAEGLSNATINVISQDSKGFLWIGTSHGLHKYESELNNGTRFMLNLPVRD